MPSNFCGFFRQECAAAEIVPKCARTFEKLTVASLANLLWEEHKFNYGITGLKKAEKMPGTMFVLVSRTH